MGNKQPTVEIRSETKNELGLVKTTARDSMERDLTVAVDHGKLTKARKD